MTHTATNTTVVNYPLPKMGVNLQKNIVELESQYSSTILLICSID